MHQRKKRSKSIFTAPHFQKLSLYEKNLLSLYIYNQGYPPVSDTIKNNIGIKQIQRLIKQGYPVEYITQKTIFSQIQMQTTSHSLIPRNETEYLVKRATKLLQKRKYSNIIDVGTGIGNIIIAIAKKYHDYTTRYWATDNSPIAIETAQKNAKKLKIKFIACSLLSKIPIYKQKVLVTANLPYLTIDDLPQIDIKTIRYEPHNALFSKNLIIFDKLFKQIKAKQFYGDILLEAPNKYAHEIIKKSKHYLLISACSVHHVPTFNISILHITFRYSPHS